MILMKATALFLSLTIPMIGFASTVNDYSGKKQGLEDNATEAQKATQSCYTNAGDYINQYKKEHGNDLGIVKGATTKGSHYTAEHFCHTAGYDVLSGHMGQGGKHKESGSGSQRLCIKTFAHLCGQILLGTVAKCSTDTSISLECCVNGAPVVDSKNTAACQG